MHPSHTVASRGNVLLSVSLLPNPPRSMASGLLLRRRHASVFRNFLSLPAATLHTSASAHVCLHSRGGGTRISQAFRAGLGPEQPRRLWPGNPSDTEEPEIDESAPHRPWMNKEKDEAMLAELSQRNQEFIAECMQEQPEVFENSQVHNPRFLIVGCSDARVPVESVFKMKPGEAFVHRNVGNLVVGTDLNFLSVLQYAVDVLKVEHILVCGHYECGACRAAVVPQDMGLIENWLRNIRDVHRLNHKELSQFSDPLSSEFHRRLVELNVREQCVNLFKTSTVQHSRTQFGTPSVHGFVYDIESGEMKFQDAGLYDYLRRYKHIYRLYN